MENDNNSLRVVWIDYLKTIAIVLVILFHSGLVTCRITVPLLAMCVPLFFVANGALILRRERGVWYFIRKLPKILFLIVFWGALSDLIKMLLRNESLDIVDIALAGITFKYGYSNHLWFLGTLFVLYIVYPVIQGSIKSRSITVFILLVSFLFSFRAFGYRIPTFAVPNILAYWQGEAVFFAIFGLFVVNHVYADTCSNPITIGFYNDEKQELPFLRISKKCLIIILLSLFVIFWFFQMLMYVGSEFFTKHTPSDNAEAVFELYKSPFVMLMVAVVVVLLKLFSPSRNKLVEFIGSNTLGMYVMHMIFMIMIRNWVVSCNAWFTNLLSFLSGFILSLLFTWFMRKNKVTSFFVTL